MKSAIIGLFIMGASVCQANIIFKDTSMLSKENQVQLQQAVELQCPASKEQQWTIYESETQTVPSAAQVVIVMSDFAVYGVDEYGQQPENGGMTVYSTISTDGSLTVAEIKGMCR
jgi:hypothetical protein